MSSLREARLLTPGNAMLTYVQCTALRGMRGGECAVQKMDMRRVIIIRLCLVTIILLGLGLFARWRIIRPIRCLPDCIGANLMDQDLRGLDLSNSNFTEANLRRANLEGTNLRNTDLSGSNLTEAKLRHANLSLAKLIGADLTRANLGDAILLGTDMRGAILAQADLTRDDLREVLLLGATLNKATLVGVNLRSI